MNTPKKIGPVTLEVPEVVSAALWSLRVIYIAIVIAVLSLCVLRFYTSKKALESFVPLLSVSIGLFAFYQLLRWWTARRATAVKESMRGLIWIIEEQGLTIGTERGQVELPWREQKGCAIRAGMLVIKNRGGLQCMMPTRALASKEEARETAAWIDARIQAARN